MMEAVLKAWVYPHVLAQTDTPRWLADVQKENVETEVQRHLHKKITINLNENQFAGIFSSALKNN